MQYKAKLNSDPGGRLLDAAAEEKIRKAQREHYKKSAAHKRHIRQSQRSEESLRNPEEEKIRSAQLQGRSGSRYADKNPDLAKEDGSSVKGGGSSRYPVSQQKAKKVLAPIQALAEWRNAVKLKDPLAIMGVLLLCACLAGYIWVAVYFNSRFYDDTKIYGIDCSRMTVDEVKEAVKEKVADYKLVLVERGNEESISAAEVGLQSDNAGALENQMSSQQS